MYYTFLVLWLISFNNKSINSFRDPAVFFFIFPFILEINILFKKVKDYPADD